jgi:hypothetical protein
MKNELKDVRFAEWSGHIKEQESSGVSRQEFCKQKDLKVSRFNYYCNRLKKMGKPQVSAFSPVKIISKENSTSTDIKLSLPNGFSLSFSCLCEPARVKQLVEALLSC